MQGRTADGRTLAREACLLEFAQDLAKIARMPLRTTGGIRRRAIAERVVTGGMALVGLGTALAYDPDLPSRWQHTEAAAKPVSVNWKNEALASLAAMATVRRQLHRTSRRKSANAERRTRKRSFPLRRRSPPTAG